MKLTRFLLLPLILLAACAEERFDPFNYGEGDADIRATVEFENLLPNTLSRAGTDGNAIGAVGNLQMVIYRIEAGETNFYKRVVCNDLQGYVCSNNGKEAPSDADKNDQDPNANSGTFEPTGEVHDHADFTYAPLPYGRYKIYAVANYPGLTDEMCKTEEDLKSLEFAWDSNVPSNNKMFGYFTRSDDQSSTGFDAPVIIVNSKQLDLHAWIKRQVSKVTIAFDPSGLKEAVTVYIKSATIHDIPNSCFLGKNNSPDNLDQLIKDGQTIEYYEKGGADDYNKWVKLQKGSGRYGSHGNNAEALFFFENMQGNYPGQPGYDKQQFTDSVGHKIDTPDTGDYEHYTNDFKDRVKYGSYIEVEAYYVSKNIEKMSSGKIKYRFMLGKDIYYNYDAQRNYHYKLTLKFRGFANDADWHISYDEPTPSLYTPDTYYISYLYGQELGYPVRIITGDEENTSRYVLKAEITENPWWPYDEVTGGYPNIYVGTASNFNAFAWMASAVESNVPEGVLDKPKYVGDYRDIAGFLSLRKPEMKNGKYMDIEFPDVREPEDSRYYGLSYGPKYTEALMNYYFDKKVAHAAYTLADGTRNVGLYDEENNVFTTGSSADGQYTVTRDNDGSVTLSIPMWTRPKKMIAAADFTGNNPYYSYMRRALVKFTLWNEKGEQVSFKDLADNEKEVKERIVPIMQVRRIENPKAIYRTWNNDAPFNVQLMQRRDQVSGTAVSPASKFSTFTSDGPWRASIMVDPNNLVKLRGMDGKEISNVGEYIHGSSGTAIEFDYIPNGTCASANSTRCAIILVEYHDYTCNHLIFVRQGYDAGVSLGGTNWSCYQVYATGRETTSADDNEPENIKNCNVIVTKSPLSMGSLLKRCQYNYSFRDGGNPGWLASATGNLTVTFIDKNNGVGTKESTWNASQAYGWRNYSGSQIRYDRGWADTWKTLNLASNKSLTVPTNKQYEDLRDQCDFGFGIAYADGATSTAEELDAAFGYVDTNNAGLENTYGTRVCVAYDSSNGNNVLFPLGSTGNGRRCRNGAPRVGNPPSTLKVESPGAGTLSYGGLSSVLYTDMTENRPITYNHYRTPGAVYWTKLPYYSTDKTLAYASWDINYFTLTFNKYDPGSIANYEKPYNANNTTASDALPIKLVYK